MTFPTVAGTNTSTQASSTTHSVALPASIAAGDLLIVFFGYGNSLDDATTPSGWTQFINVSNGGRFYGYYKVASGSEGATLSITTGSAGTSAHTSYRITGYQGTPEAATATGSSATPDPPNLAPSWGAADTLWLAATHCVNGSADATVPTNYTGIIQSFQSPFNTASASRQLNAASENPGTFGGADNNVWETATVAVRPAGAGAAAKMKYYGQRRAA